MMADPSIAGAAQALVEHLRSTFPSVPLDTISAITAQHSSDPNKCWDLVRLESSRPTSAEPVPYANGGADATWDAVFIDRQYPFVPASIMRPRGSYVIRRSQDTPSLRLGAMRDTRSCTPPRVPPDPNQRLVMTPPITTFGPVTRPQTLDVHPTLSHRSPSPAGHHLPAANTDATYSCPGTPTGISSAPRASRGIVGNIPALKINCNTNCSQITLSPSLGPNSPTLVVSSQPSGGEKPVYYHLGRTGPSGVVGVTPSGIWQYVRRPSYADVEVQRAASPQPTSTLNSSGLRRDSLRASVDNLNDGFMGALASPNAATSSGHPLIRIPASVMSSSPNIRISVDPRSCGATISGDPASCGAGRARPRVTFGPMVAIQPGYSHSGPALTVSLRQPTPQYDSSTLMKTAAITKAQTEKCLKSVLEHQRSRLAEMKKAMTSTRTRLKELRTDVESMEQDLARSRKHSIRSAAINDDEMTLLHKEKRELQEEIQTMLRELELHRQNAGRTTRTFLDAEFGASDVAGGLDNRITVPARIAADLGAADTQRANFDSDAINESEQWLCSLCTFRNHVELPVCECCEMPRVTDD